MSCEFLKKGQYIVPEISKGSSLSVYPKTWVCILMLHHQGMDWDKCKQTPNLGPCWQMTRQFQTIEEWQIWVKRQTNKQNVSF